ncbi:hypothetical protein [Candidatus Arthromitus sp. SFB-rat-Yit]|uniref:hypothetical protein n=1 Tax=Candidatus Arthromitus sp. SFB-rat-Yit TaxID=1041504 RepID=UPI000227A5F4|nr:hypothetical protein [Candidatus Arthromitus sp. SFB-rat-Yit]BAK81649.1 hypothetical protein RATSFB_1087 [Candidatus Arthromitus sp. SFB-rat-Yit]
MRSEQNHDKKLSNNESLFKDIVNLDKFKKMDDRYIISDICKNTDFKYDFKNDSCNIYYRSFALNISFDIMNKFKSIAGFIDLNLCGLSDKNKFISLLDKIIFKKELDISISNLREIIDNVTEDIIKEYNIRGNKLNFYINKIVNIDRELIFMLINLN